MAYKYNYELAKKIVEQKGFKLISKEFKCIDEYLTIQSKEGYFIKTTLNTVIRKDNFNYFDHRNPYTIKNINLWIHLNNKNIVLLDNEFVNAKFKMDFECLDCGDTFKMNWNNVKTGKGCRNCSYMKRGKKRKKHDTLNIKEQLKKINPDIEILGEYKSYHDGMLCKCLKHDIQWEATWSNLRKGKGCYECGLEKNKRENHHNWKGGITPLHNHLRGIIQKWKIASFEKHNYTCDITGVKCNSNVVHHLYGFDSILQETMSTLNLPIHENIQRYTIDELTEIEQLCLKLHFKYGLGVCLSEEIHVEFHRLYGYGKNTPEQYFEFKKTYID